MLPARSHQLPIPTESTFVKLSRSAFLKLCATGVVGLAADAELNPGAMLFAASEPAAAAAGVGASFEWARASAVLFQPHVGTVFHARDAAGSAATLHLTRITTRASGPAMEQFSLVFRVAAAGGIVPQGICTFRHDTLGEFDLYLSAIGTSRERACEACFTRYLERT